MNTASIVLRSVARRLGLIKAINFFRYSVLRISQEYEEQFGHAMLSHVEPGDVVWDVGANLGLYTQQFVDRVGVSGKVFAFEPAPACFEVLTGKFRGVNSVQVENVAMGLNPRTVKMRLEENPLAATHRVLEGIQEAAERGDDTDVVEVVMVNGDSYWKSAKCTPNVIKIDVEGFEEQVLRGMPELLKSPDLRAIFCEVHFALLEARGERMAPKRIEQLLVRSGFETTWIDASHIRALRL